ncbi:MAG: hypothetical protein IJZ72_06440 [Oscillospiraceae bacterium]|nr:hypothetical protein [Oscillospiraceae bacterium]
MRPFCKKCFLAEIDHDGVYQSIKEMIAALPDENRADENEYRRRLDICGRCSQLNEGVCLKCGCFVELRAAKKDMGCPHEKHLWAVDN